MSLISIANAAESVAEPMATTGTSLMSLLPMILIFVIFYFFLIRPQVKRQKTIENMVNELKKGDHVVAAGGLYGSVSKIDDNILYLEIAENIKVKILKSSVTEVLTADTKSEPAKTLSKANSKKIAKVTKTVTKTKKVTKSKK